MNCFGNVPAAKLILALIQGKPSSSRVRGMNELGPQEGHHQRERISATGSCVQYSECAVYGNGENNNAGFRGSGGNVGICRNCGAEDTKDLGYIGQIAPFVLKRVLNLEFGYAASRRTLKRLARRFALAGKVAEKLYGKSVLAEIEICLKCSFLQMKYPFAEASLARLYEDYRSDSYNRERIHCEPTYAAIASQVGRCAQEIEARTTGLTRWLTPRISIDPDFRMLDYGGADGRFLPKLPGSKFVFEISKVPPISGVTRINHEGELDTYSYVQLAHVLEHVPYPADLTKKAARHVSDSGYLYIEVPQEVSDAELARLANGDTTVPVGIHEHINWYSQKSVRGLLTSAGLRIESIDSEEVDFGWTVGTVIRALARPNPNSTAR